MPEEIEAGSDTSTLPIIWPRPGLRQTGIRPGVLAYDETCETPEFGSGLAEAPQSGKRLQNHCIRQNTVVFQGLRASTTAAAMQAHEKTWPAGLTRDANPGGIPAAHDPPRRSSSPS